MKILEKLFPAFFQSKDNNKSLENQLENEIWTDDFNARVEQIQKRNIAHCLVDLKKYIISKELEKTGLLLPKQEARTQAVQFFFNLKKCHLLDDMMNLKPAIKEVIEG